MSAVSIQLLQPLQIEAAADDALTIKNIITQELIYQKNMTADSTISTQNEWLAYRWLRTKKFIESCLFLEVNQQPGSPFLLHTLYGIAAALSMVFATFVAFYGQGLYGQLSNQLFLALVISYIFKDRIKEVMRSRLFSLFRRWIPDRRLKIYHNHQYDVGHCKEFYFFINDQHLNDDIKKRRERLKAIEILNEQRHENILFYKKNVTLFNHPKLFKQTQYSVIDITRFNIADFFKYIDEIYEEIPVIEQDQIKNIAEPKTYHIDLVRKIHFEENISYESVKLIVDSSGIKRLILNKEADAHSVK